MVACLNGAQAIDLGGLVDEVDKVAEMLSADGTKRRLSDFARRTS